MNLLRTLEFVWIRSEIRPPSHYSLFKLYKPVCTFLNTTPNMHNNKKLKCSNLIQSLSVFFSKLHYPEQDVVNYYIHQLFRCTCNSEPGRTGFHKKKKKKDLNLCASTRNPFPQATAMVWPCSCKSTSKSCTPVQKAHSRSKSAGREKG